MRTRCCKVTEVKGRAAAGEKKADIAREFGVSQATVYRVLAG